MKTRLKTAAGVLLGAALVAAACLQTPPALAATPAAEPVWQTLPPTPELPDTAVQGWADVNGIRLWHARYGATATGAAAGTATGAAAGALAGAAAAAAGTAPAAATDQRPPTVLLLHGGFASSNYYGHLVPFLVAKGYEVLVVDSRGQGRSTASGAPFSYKLFASDIAALLTSLRTGAVDIVGWSDGGIVGIEMALRHQQLVRRVFAFGANVNLQGLKPDIEKNPTFAQYLSRTEAEYAKLSATPQAFATISKKVLAMWSSQPNYSRAELARINKPVTIADGQFDEALRPEHQMFMARAIRGANLVVLPNASHFAMLQNPAQFNDAVLAFLLYR